MIRHLQAVAEKIALLSFRPFRDKSQDKKGICLVCKKEAKFIFNSWIVSKDIEKNINQRDEFASLLARESFFCNKCLTSDRKRILYKHLLNYLSRKINKAIFKIEECDKKLTVLIIGNLGTRSYLQSLVSSSLACVTTYFDPDEIIGKKRLNSVNADVHDLTFLETRFDIILHTDVLEHCQNPVVAIESCMKMLKHDGVLIFTIPIRLSLSQSYPAQQNNQKIWHGRGKWIFSLLPKQDGYLERHVFGSDYAEYLCPKYPEQLKTFRYFGSNNNEIIILELKKSLSSDKLLQCT